MDESQSKFLVNFFSQFSREQLFIGFWLMILGLFLLSATRFLGGRSQRNFRNGPSTPQKPPTPSSSKAVSVPRKDLTKGPRSR